MSEVEALRERLADEVAAREQAKRCGETLRKLRRMVGSIQSGEGTERIADAIKQCLEAARINFAGYGVNLIEERSGQFHISQHATQPDGKRFYTTRTQDAPDLLTKWWSEGRTIYRRDLLESDPYDELATWASEGPTRPRSIVDTPFSGGTFAVSSLDADAFTDADLEFFRDLADVLDAATRRWQDLRQLEERNGLLGRQVAEAQARTEQLALANTELAEKKRLLDAFHETGKALLESLDLDHILDTLCRQIIQAGIFRGVMIALVDRTRHKVRVARSFNRTRDETGAWQPLQASSSVVGIEYDLDDDNVTAEVARTGELTVIGGWDQRFDSRFNKKQMEDKTSYFIPIVHDGHPVAVLATGSPPADQDEMLRQIEILGPFFDLVAISLHHAHLYRDLQERERELRQSQKMEIMGEMTAGIAHNFNNLLQGVIGNLDFALDTPEDAPSLIAKAMASADSLAEMVRQLMAYSRKGLMPERAPTELASIINSVSRVCQSTFDPQIEFIQHVPDGVPPLTAMRDNWNRFC